MYWKDRSVGSRAEGNQVSFYADAVADVSNLPDMAKEGVPQGNDPEANKKVACGSSCFVIATSEVYILNSANVWTKI